MTTPATQKLRSGPLVAAATLLGLGMGGFIDGILLHQTLQWHQMLSNSIPPTNLIAKNINMFWDGIFHIFTWLLTFSGIVLLWKLFYRPDVVKSTSIFIGGMIFGWGLFNTIDSIANHYILEFHNVRESVPDPWIWNLGFLIFSMALMILGWFIIIKGRKKIQLTI